MREARASLASGSIERSLDLGMVEAVSLPVPWPETTRPVSAPQAKEMTGSEALPPATVMVGRRD